jgi:hypothetical protein
MAGQGCTSEKVDSRAGVVGAREREVRDMIERAEKDPSAWDQARVEHLAETVYSVGIAQAAAYHAWDNNDPERALRFLKLALSREVNEEKRAKLEGEIAEAQGTIAT